MIAEDIFHVHALRSGVFSHGDSLRAREIGLGHNLSLLAGIQDFVMSADKENRLIVDDRLYAAAIAVIL